MTEAISLEEQCLTRAGRQRVTETVTEVGAGRVPASLSIISVCLSRDARLARRHRRDLDSQVQQEIVEPATLHPNSGCSAGNVLP